MDDFEAGALPCHLLGHFTSLGWQPVSGGVVGRAGSCCVICFGFEHVAAKPRTWRDSGLLRLTSQPGAAFEARGKGLAGQSKCKPYALIGQKGADESQRRE